MMGNAPTGRKGGKRIMFCSPGKFGVAQVRLILLTVQYAQRYFIQCVASGG